MQETTTIHKTTTIIETSDSEPEIIEIVHETITLVNDIPRKPVEQTPEPSKKSKKNKNKKSASDEITQEITKKEEIPDLVQEPDTFNESLHDRSITEITVTNQTITTFIDQEIKFISEQVVEPIQSEPLENLAENIIEKLPIVKEIINVEPEETKIIDQDAKQYEEPSKKPKKKKSKKFASTESQESVKTDEEFSERITVQEIAMDLPQLSIDVEEFVPKNQRHELVQEILHETESFVNSKTQEKLPEPEIIIEEAKIIVEPIVEKRSKKDKKKKISPTESEEHPIQKSPELSVDVPVFVPRSRIMEQTVSFLEFEVAHQMPSPRLSADAVPFFPRNRTVSFETSSPELEMDQQMEDIVQQTISEFQHEVTDLDEPETISVQEVLEVTSKEPLKKSKKKKNKKSQDDDQEIPYHKSLSVEAQDFVPRSKIIEEVTFDDSELLNAKLIIKEIEPIQEPIKNSEMFIEQPQISVESEVPDFPQIITDELTTNTVPENVVQEFKIPTPIILTETRTVVTQELYEEFVDPNVLAEELRAHDLNVQEFADANKPFENLSPEVTPSHLRIHNITENVVNQMLDTIASSQEELKIELAEQNQPEIIKVDDEKLASTLPVEDSVQNVQTEEFVEEIIKPEVSSNQFRMQLSTFEGDEHVPENIVEQLSEKLSDEESKLDLIESTKPGIVELIDGNIGVNFASPTEDWNEMIEEPELIVQTTAISDTIDEIFGEPINDDIVFEKPDEEILEFLETSEKYVKEKRQKKEKPSKVKKSPSPESEATSMGWFTKSDSPSENSFGKTFAEVLKSDEEKRQRMAAPKPAPRKVVESFPDPIAFEKIPTAPKDVVEIITEPEITPKPKRKKNKKLSSNASWESQSSQEFVEIEPLSQRIEENIVETIVEHVETTKKPKKDKKKKLSQEEIIEAFIESEKVPEPELITEKSSSDPEESIKKPKKKKNKKLSQDPSQESQSSFETVFEVVQTTTTETEILIESPIEELEPTNVQDIELLPENLEEPDKKKSKKDKKKKLQQDKSQENVEEIAEPLKSLELELLPEETISDPDSSKKSKKKKSKKTKSIDDDNEATSLLNSELIDQNTNPTPIKKTQETAAPQSSPRSQSPIPNTGSGDARQTSLDASLKSSKVNYCNLLLLFRILMFVCLILILLIYFS